MNNLKLFMILSLTVLLFTCIGCVCAAGIDNSTISEESDISFEEKLSGEINIAAEQYCEVEDLNSYDKRDELTSNVLTVNQEEVLSDYVSFKGDIFNNPNGIEGASSDIKTSYYDDFKRVKFNGITSYSQYINLNVIDSFNFYILADNSYRGFGNPIMIYCDDEVLTGPIVYYDTAGWTYISVDVSNITGWHTLTFESLLGNYDDYWHYTYASREFSSQLRNFNVVRNDFIDAYFNISDICVEEDGINVKFVDKSYGFLTSWFWDFGDGFTSTEQNPTHLYKEAGVYDVSLTLSDDNSFTTLHHTLNVRDLLNVDFDCDERSGFKNLTVNFNDLSDGDIIEWFWDFGDGFTSTEQNPTHTYNTLGNYNVTLTIANEIKSLNITKNSLIKVSDEILADFSNDNVYSLSVPFNDLSEGNPTSWLWDFGDGFTSTEKNPTHRFASIGHYNVTLNAYSDFNSSKITKTVHVNAKTSEITINNINKRLMLSGALKDNNGNPIWDAIVHYCMNGVWSNVTTQGDGSFAIQGISNATIGIVFNSSAEYNSSSYNVVLGDYLVKDAVIEVENPYNMVVIDSKVGEPGKYFNFNLKDANGNVLRYKNLKVTINDVDYDVVSDVNGKVSLQTSLDRVGNYLWKISFLDDEDYKDTVEDVKIVVSKKTTSITPIKTSYTFKSTDKAKYVQATLKTSNEYLTSGKKVTLTINGKKYSVKAENGEIKFNIASFKKKGTYNVRINFAGDSIYKSSTSNNIKIKITMNKEKTKITAKAKTFKKSKKTKKYTITLKNSKGKAVKKAKVTLKVKGKTYKAKTNSKGKATFKITKLTKKGIYNVKIKFAGDSIYKSSTSKNIKIKIS